MDRATMRDWVEWAPLNAHSIDPIVAARRADVVLGPVTTPVAELDLTSGARAAVAQLDVNDTDALWRCSKDDVSRACTNGSGAIWNELTRVLEALKYDVCKREKAYQWS